ncbi:3-oxoacyl-[acyl-carrier-protein] synthase III [Gottschalkia acidurici 9a]|uniref:Beta-ketoacyl-[acyl-carrier-protein] synthase III n=1 Tax=Gottschalkia acidurici (strain ATCC 7906 / DSM 604 / BCRC 14475 / CIP 104303 / KCTC 5404 / NCIMB 10678 / 9a) TaxID=1128398 RepID=K0AXW1_GOTA9|nr:beta-ketoacyl-ACP synthase III [Gottschalkia acidurici]AFS78643.1 3-oxoacyl-[acyl-carrier-protein] synthase III [Gottschalkia acidurici 9a]
MSKGIGIVGTGSFLPEKILSNFDLEKIVDTSDEWITTRTGIKERRILEKDKASSDMAVEASKKALEQSNLTPLDIDLIIVATMTPDMTTPSTACIVQEKLGCRNAAAFDLSAACSGFIYGLSVAYSFVKSGVYKRILLIGTESMSRILDWEDRSTCILFGDGAGAVVIGEVPEGKGILQTELGSDGSGAEHLLVPAGGSKCPITKEVLDERLQYLKMEGSEVFKFAVRKIEEVSKSVLEKSELRSEDINYLIPHQANTRIIDSAIKKLKISSEKVYVNLSRYGNMSAASIPVALDEAVREGKINDGDNILLVGFGGGLTWGASTLKWHGK